MSLHQAVSILNGVMDEWGLTTLEKGRVLAELGKPDASKLTQKVWTFASKRMKARGIVLHLPSHEGEEAPQDVSSEAEERGD